jgi:flagellar basal-body rod protein FlgF
MSSDVSSFVLLSHEQALRRKLDIATNNMANVNTIGYKREQALFREHIERAKEAPVKDAKKTSYVLDYGAVHDSRPGSFQPTGNRLDLMIEGAGYFSVDTGDGGTSYTRAGMFRLQEDGTLVTTTGNAVLDDNGRAITIPDDQAASLSIASDGTISTTTGPVARIGITVFDEMRVSVRGDGLVEGGGGRLLAPAETHLVTGGLEGSNVQPIIESTSMVEILRAYQTSMEMSQSIDTMRKQAIGRLSRAE